MDTAGHISGRMEDVLFTTPVDDYGVLVDGFVRFRGNKELMRLIATQIVNGQRGPRRTVSIVHIHITAIETMEIDHKSLPWKCKTCRDRGFYYCEDSYHGGTISMRCDCRLAPTACGHGIDRSKKNCAECNTEDDALMPGGFNC